MRNSVSIRAEKVKRSCIAEDRAHGNYFVKSLRVATPEGLVTFDTYVKERFETLSAVLDAADVDPAGE